MHNNTFFAGCSKAAIPYPDDFFPYHSWGPRRLTGIHDDLCVRVIYIKEPGELLLVSVENGDIDPEWNQRLSDYTGILPANILISVTHTHTAPYIGGYWPEDVEDVEKSNKYTEKSWSTLIAAVDNARESVEPVFLKIGYGTCDVNVNRDLPVKDNETGKVVYKTGKNIHGETDRVVTVLNFVAADDKPKAVLFNYGVHSSILFGTRMKDGGQLASGDLAGNAMAKVENELGCVCMYTMAPAADLDPRFFARGFAEPENSGAYYAIVDALGQELYEEVLYVIDNMTRNITADQITSIENTVYVPGKVKKDGHGIPWPKSPSDYEPADDVPLPLAVTAIGQLAIVSIGCETSSRNTEKIKSIMHEAGFTDTLIITQCNGSSSYMSDEKGYQVVTFSAMASHMMPQAVDCMFEELELLCKKLIQMSRR